MESKLIGGRGIIGTQQGRKGREDCSKSIKSIKHQNRQRILFHLHETGLAIDDIIYSKASY